jgi:transaldolase
MKANPLKKLTELGQSIWLDFINRELITSGKLQRLIAEDSLRGLTSNPSIFEKAFSEGNDYDQTIRALVKETKNINDIYETLALRDVRDAADQFRGLYDQTAGKDGYASMEVNPHLARDTEGTIEEGRRLWKELNRPNVLIKVPGTREGLPAITQLISEGINVNVTLLFGVPRYRQVVEAYMTGLEERAAQGKPLASIASVASFFLSRIDVLVDPMLEKQGQKNLQGQTAIASAKIAYQIFNELFNSDRFKKLAEKSAQMQRLLWASTSTKNPAYSDVKYVEALIGKNTVNTVPMETLEAYRDHGNPKPELDQNIAQAKEIFAQLLKLEINIDKITQQLEDEGVEKFAKSFDQLTATLKKKCDL